MAKQNHDPKIIGDRYKVIGILGRGGVGKVYKCNDLQLDRIVAVKVLFDHSEDLITRFHSEAKVSAKLNHESIVNVIDFGITNDSEPFLAMEYLEGESLKNKIKREGRLDSTEVLPLAMDIAAGLAHAHDHAILHRDIKPSNIMLIRKTDGRTGVKIVDFGIAKNISNIDQHLTSTGVIIGTPLYLSPEAVEGKTVDIRSEVYSFGCLLYEALSGIAPFESDTTMTTMMARLDEEPPVLEDSDDWVYPEEVKAVVSKCLERNPDKRYANFEQLREALSQALEAITLTSLIEEPEESKDKEGILISPDAFQTKEKRSKIPLVIGILLLFFVVSGFIIYPMLNDTKKNSGPVKHISHKSILEDNIFSETSINRIKDTSGREWITLVAFSGKPEMFKPLISAPNVDYLSAQYDDMSSFDASILEQLKLKGISFKECKIDQSTLEAISLCPTLEVVLLPGVSEDNPKNFQLLNRLTKLEELDLSATDIRDVDLAAFNNLTGLKTVNLYKCKSITGSSLKAFRNCESLSVISLGHSGLEFQFLKDLAPLPITNINLSALKLKDGDITPLLSMPLLSLNLEGTMITDTGLEKLAASLPNLQELFIQGCKNVNGRFLKHLNTLPKLRSLSLRGTDFKKKNLKNLAKSNSITSLDLGDLFIKDSDLNHLFKLPLIELALENTEITDAGLMKLSKIKSLRRLFIKDCKSVTSSGLASFQNKMRACKVDTSLIERRFNSRDLIEQAIEMQH